MGWTIFKVLHVGAAQQHARKWTAASLQNAATHRQLFECLQFPLRIGLTLTECFEHNIGIFRIIGEFRL